jgi:LPXTG-motif cell wall-anchored protein
MQMKRYAATALAGLVTLLFLLVNAAPAQAYPDVVMDVSVDHQTMVGGTPFTAFANASVQCQWTLQFRNQTATGQGNHFRHTFSTPVVHKKKVFALHAACVYANDPGSASATSSETRTIPITLLPSRSEVSPPRAGSGHGQAGHHGERAGANGSDQARAGDLPNTGGPATWPLYAGILLVVLGLLAVYTARRRRRGDPAD